MSQPDFVGASIDLFVYGTLLFEEIVRALTYRVFHTQQATLHGFTRHAIIRQGDYAPYPAIQPDAAGSVPGRVLMNVDPASMRRIDCFESDPPDYRVTSVIVECADGQRRRTTTYVALESLRLHFAGERSMETFRRSDLDHYVTRVISRLRRELRFKARVSR